MVSVRCQHLGQHTSNDAFIDPPENGAGWRLCTRSDQFCVAISIAATPYQVVTQREAPLSATDDTSHPLTDTNPIFAHGLCVPSAV